MKLRQRKRLLNGTAAACVLLACWIVASAMTAEPPTAESVSPTTKSTDKRIAADTNSPFTVVDASLPSWQRKLRRPLYDPPPPPKVVVKKKTRPVNFKLTGTVLEPKNSQAFLRLANGSVALKRIGDQVTNDPRDGKITEITASEIVIQRETDEVRLKVGG